MILLIIFCGIWAFERVYKITQSKRNGAPTWKDIENKVSKGDCKSFKTRIGNESYQHTKDIDTIQDTLLDIKENVGFIRGKMESRL